MKIAAVIFCVFICIALAYLGGLERGYRDALDDIFGPDAPRCPHGNDWDHCPDCCH